MNGELHDRSKVGSLYLLCCHLLREAFQGLFYAVFLGFIALAQLLSLRRANSLIAAFQLPKIQNFGLFSYEIVSCMLLQLCFLGMQKLSWLHLGELEIFLSFHAVLDFFQLKPAACSRRVAVPSV